MPGNDQKQLVLGCSTWETTGSGKDCGKQGAHASSKGQQLHSFTQLLFWGEFGNKSPMLIDFIFHLIYARPCSECLIYCLNTSPKMRWRFPQTSHLNQFRIDFLGCERQQYLLFVLFFLHLNWYFLGHFVPQMTEWCSLMKDVALRERKMLPR